MNSLETMKQLDNAVLEQSTLDGGGLLSAGARAALLEAEVKKQREAEQAYYRACKARDLALSMILAGRYDDYPEPQGESWATYIGRRAFQQAMEIIETLDALLPEQPERHGGLTCPY